MSRDKIEVGFFSTGKFVCETPGSLTIGYGGGSCDHCYQVGTIYNDATSSLVWVENQLSLGSHETFMGKSQF